MHSESLRIIFEDENLLVVDKPSGLVVHPYDHSTEKTLLEALAAHDLHIFEIQNTKTLQDGRIINLGGLVHKLDRETSGVMVVAKNKDTWGKLSKLFREHHVEKTYIALVEGLVKENSFTIDKPLGRAKKDFKQTTDVENIRGIMREAVTYVGVIKRNKDTTLVELKPKTGRTHQLRAHMASIGHPISGDISYGSMNKETRIMLHAQKIYFVLDEKEYSFEVETPKEFD